MIYSSTVFIFFTLASLFVFYNLPNRLKTVWLLFISLCWYASWELTWLLLLLIIITLNFLGLKISQKAYKRDAFFIGLICLNVIIFLAVKSSIFGLTQFDLPFGSSFYIFILMALVIDGWRSPEKIKSYRWSEFFLLPSFFPLLMGGPIERGQKFFSELRSEKKLLIDNILNGIIIFSIGFIKKEVILGPLSAFSFEEQTGIMVSVLRGFLATFLTYLEFSSFTEMGRGVARMFGIDLSLSFKPFYFSKNPNDFWQRWNITIGTWLRDYLSFPLMLKYGRVLGQNFILFFTFLLMGLWHGLSWKHLYFGVFNGLIITIFNFTNKKFKLPFWGQLWAFILIIGNGLLLGEPFVQRDVAKPLLWSQFLSLEHLKLIIPLILLLVYDWFLEKYGEDFWKSRLSILAKGFFCLVFAVLFFWHIDSIKDPSKLPDDVPIYFKI